MRTAASATGEAFEQLQARSPEWASVCPRHARRPATPSATTINPISADASTATSPNTTGVRPETYTLNEPESAMQNRRQFLSAAAGASVAPAPASPPNIVVILADDMGFSDIGPYGGEIRTPNLDRLASRGVRFTQFYNAARCCPTRALLLTGLYPHQAGVGHMVDNPKPFPGYKGDLSANSVTIAEALKPAGYRTYMSGKWHVTPVTNSPQLAMPARLRPFLRDHPRSRQLLRSRHPETRQ